MRWRYIAASVRGTSHVEQDIECQDASVAHEIEDDVLLLVASDGAGSAKHSSCGSQLVCDTLREEVASYVSAGGSVDRIDEDLVDRWIEVLVRRLHIQAGALGQPVRELACTLVAAILGRDSSVYLQLGDGAIVGDSDGGYV